MKKNPLNRKVSIKDYELVLGCSKKTAVKYRRNDRKELGLKKDQLFLYSAFIKIYGVEK